MGTLALFMIGGAVLALAAAGGLKAIGRTLGVGANVSLSSGKPRPRIYVTTRRARPSRNLR